MRGGVSSSRASSSMTTASSPRAWGCFHLLRLLAGRRHVFPTCVGVFPTCRHSGPCIAGLPHVRGGVSDSGVRSYVYAASSPRAWGCFSREVNRALQEGVFPTCVGVFLVTPDFTSLSRGSSPRAWGCFSVYLISTIKDKVFPTCVGVFPDHHQKDHQKNRLPHVRGGVSP